MDTGSFFFLNESTGRSLLIFSWLTLATWTTSPLHMLCFHIVTLHCIRHLSDILPQRDPLSTIFFFCCCFFYVNTMSFRAMCLSCLIGPVFRNHVREMKGVLTALKHQLPPQDSIKPAVNKKCAWGFVSVCVWQSIRAGDLVTGPRKETALPSH